MHPATSYALLDELEKIAKSRWKAELEAGNIASWDLPKDVRHSAGQHEYFTRNPQNFGWKGAPTGSDTIYAENVRKMRSKMTQVPYDYLEARQNYGDAPDSAAFGVRENLKRRHGMSEEQINEKLQDIRARRTPAPTAAAAPAAPQAAPVAAKAPSAVPHQAPAAPVHTPAAAPVAPHAPTATPHVTPTTGLMGKVQGMSLGKKVGIGAGLVGAAALGGYALHRRHQAQQAQAQPRTV